jgi:hypothetical protein
MTRTSGTAFAPGLVFDRMENERPGARRTIRVDDASAAGRLDGIPSEALLPLALSGDGFHPSPLPASVLRAARERCFGRWLCFYSPPRSGAGGA